MLKRNKNSLLTQADCAVDLSLLNAKTVHKRGLAEKRRELRDLRKNQLAAEAIAGLDRETEIFGFTKGQFSLLHLLHAIFVVTGPAHLSISTWTAAPFEIRAIRDMIQRGDVTGTRWLIDFSMARRDPAATSQLRDAVGDDSVRVAQNHAKFAIFQNPEWKVVLRSSMNLNMNPRFEDFTVAHDPELAAFLNAILDEIWARQSRQTIDDTPYEICKHWRDEL